MAVTGTRCAREVSTPCRRGRGGGDSPPRECSVVSMWVARWGRRRLRGRKQGCACPGSRAARACQAGDAIGSGRRTRSGSWAGQPLGLVGGASAAPPPPSVPPRPSGGPGGLRLGGPPAEGAAGLAPPRNGGGVLGGGAGSGPASYAGSCGRSWRHFLVRRRPLPRHLGVGRGGARRGAGGVSARHGRGGR